MNNLLLRIKVVFVFSVLLACGTHEGHRADDEASLGNDLESEPFVGDEGVESTMAGEAMSPTVDSTSAENELPTSQVNVSLST